jgi:hypothetical protein
VVEQSVNDEHGANHRHAEGRTQKPGRITAISEIPPQRVVILHVPEDDEPDQQRSSDRDDDGQHPLPGEIRLQQPAIAIEFRTAYPEQADDRRADQRLFVIHALDHREHRTGSEQRQGHAPGRFQPPHQPIGNDEQQRTDDARNEMRGLDEG